jgi:endonuclease III
MTTYELIQEKTEELEKRVKQFNELNRKAKYFKKEILQPLQKEVSDLWDKWRSEMRQQTGMGTQNF